MSYKELIEKYKSTSERYKKEAQKDTGSAETKEALNELIQVSKTLKEIDAATPTMLWLSGRGNYKGNLV